MSGIVTAVNRGLELACKMYSEFISAYLKERYL